MLLQIEVISNKSNKIWGVQRVDHVTICRTELTFLAESTTEDPSCLLQNLDLSILPFLLEVLPFHADNSLCKSVRLKSLPGEAL